MNIRNNYFYYRSPGIKIFLDWKIYLMTDNLISIYQQYQKICHQPEFWPTIGLY